VKLPTIERFIRSVIRVPPCEQLCTSTVRLDTFAAVKIPLGFSTVIAVGTDRVKVVAFVELILVAPTEASPTAVAREIRPTVGLDTFATVEIVSIVLDVVDVNAQLVVNLALGNPIRDFTPTGRELTATNMLADAIAVLEVLTLARRQLGINEIR
jgi:hypothetical protein